MGESGESCETVCERENLRCAATGHNFPPEGQSLTVNCSLVEGGVDGVPGHF